MMSDLNNNLHIDTLELDPADGKPYVFELHDKLMGLILNQQTIEDVEERLRKLYPESKLIDLAIKETNKSRLEHPKNHKSRNHSSSSGASFTGTLHSITSFAVAKVSSLVREGVAGNKAENEVNKFKESLVHFIIADVLNLAEDFVKRQKGNFIITRSDIRTAMHADKDLLDIFLSDDKGLSIMENHTILAHIGCSDKANIHHHHHHHSQQLSTMTYKQKVRNMVDAENSFIRGLKLIIKVFKAQLEELPHIKNENEIIFCNIEELLELSTLILTALEDALESVGQEDEIPYVGSEILDLAQAEEFHAYFTFAYRRLHHRKSWRQAHLNIISNESTMTSIKTAGQSFDVAVKQLLPNYLLNTIIQFFEYFKNFNELYELSKKHDNKDDELALKETLSILIKTKKAIEELLEQELDPQEIEQVDPKDFDSIRSLLERRLDAELQHERNLPLPYMPPPEIYRFSEPDSKDNIQFEDFQNHRTISSKDFDKHIRNETDQIPVIRCATLIKLVERLTYHKYQPNIVDSFLTTYRSFIPDPEELLDLLIERFKIPDPPLYVVCPNFYGSADDLSELDRTAYKHYLKRFRQEYSKPVKMRVINVLKSWIKNHYYDFERHPTLLNKLHLFLDEVYNTDKVLRSLIVSIKKSIEQKKISQRDEFEFMLPKEPPPIEWWHAKANEIDKFDLLTLHPLEFARQLTLIEFDLFRAIKPSELINVRDLGLKSRKDDKYESSPNLSRMTRHFTLLSYWIRKCIVEAEDFDKRAAIYNRCLEIMGALRDFNNFTGLLSIGSAIESAPIVRLSHTRKTLTKETMKVLEDYRELNEDHQKKLQRDLRHCNPPCIPYLGSYQTKLIHAKEGNKTFIDEVDTTSPTLSNDEWNSSFSNSPATPISPRTPLPRPSSSSVSANAVPVPLSPILPPSATSTMQNQFFGGSGGRANFRPPPINLSNISNLANGNAGMVHNNSSSTLVGSQPPSTPAPPKMINFTKQRIRAGLVAEIANYQNPPYCFKVQPEMRQFIESIESKLTDFVASLNSGDQNGNHIENNVPAMTKRLDDYLFEQSEKIEPKNCTKPLRSKSKLPEHWKSPGIKVNNCITQK